MSDSTIEPLPDGDGKLGNAEGPADAGAGDSGMPGEHDGGADGGAGGGAGTGGPDEGPADAGAGDAGSAGEHDGGAPAGMDGLWRRCAWRRSAAAWNAAARDC